jgi:hypothetical protein
MTFRIIKDDKSLLLLYFIKNKKTNTSPINELNLLTLLTI